MVIWFAHEIYRDVIHKGNAFKATSVKSRAFCFGPNVLTKAISNDVSTHEVSVSYFSGHTHAKHTFR